MKTKLPFALFSFALLCFLPAFAILATAQQPTAATTPQVSAPQAAPREQPVARRGTIKGRVLGDDGQPLAEVPVLASAIGRNAAARRPGPGGPAGAPSQTTTDEEGNFTFENLTPASYSISATVPGYIAPRRKKNLAQAFITSAIWPTSRWSKAALSLARSSMLRANC